MKKIMISISTKAEGIAELETLITRCSAMYYAKGRYLRVNVVRTYPEASALLHKQGIDIDPGVQEIDDAAFDLFWEVLTELKPRSTVLKRTGAAVSGPTKTKLPYAMNGLEQVRPESVEAWLKSHPGPYVVSDKLDGVSFEHVCRADGTADAYTKGDSDMGNRVSQMLPQLNIPQPKQDIAVRAEMIMDQALFHSRYGKDNGDSKGKLYENPRNMVAGATSPKRRELHDALGDIDVVAYELLNPRLKPSDQLKRLKTLGYKVAPHTLHKVLDSATLVKILAERKAKSKYELDGLVIAQDKMYPIATTDASAKHMVKFKYNLDDAGVKVKVLAVVWEISKRGMMIPRINIPPTRLGGVTIDFCSGHNAFFIQNGFSKKDAAKGLPVRPIGPGALIRVVRSGDVIPYCAEVIKGVAKPSMPDTAYTGGTADKGGHVTHIMHEGKSDLSEVKRITYFFTTLDVEGLKQGTVQKFYDHGLNSILKICKASAQKFLEVEGVQIKTAQKIRQNIDQALGTMTLPALMDASGFFGALGGKRLALVVKRHPDILEQDLDRYTLHNMVTDIPGYQATLAQQFVDGLPKFKKFYERLGHKAQAAKVVKAKGNAFKDQIIIFTGFRDSGMEAKIVEQGGTIGSGINAKTSLLVVKDPNATSSKIVKAKSLGIKIMSGTLLGQFLNKL